MGDNNTGKKTNTKPKPEVEDTRKMPEWHPQQEKILKKWSEVGASYRYLHDKAFLDFEKQNMGFALPVIIISTLTGTANFAQGSFPEGAKEIAPLIIGLFNIAAGLITTIAQFLRVSELMEGHRSASLQYSKFSRNLLNLKHPYNVHLKIHSMLYYYLSDSNYLLYYMYPPSSMSSTLSLILDFLS